MFGQGKELRMKFRDFLQEMEKGNTTLYLTTQDLKLDMDIDMDMDGRDEDEKQPPIISPPLSYLLHDFPLRPQLMGNLIPQNMNLWMGHTKTGKLSIPPSTSVSISLSIPISIFISASLIRRVFLWSSS